MSKSYNQYNNQHNQDNRQGNSEFYDEEEADQWRHRQQLQKKDHEERPVPKRTPDEVWLIPPNVRPVDILGEKRFHVQRIEKLTNTHMIYNEDEAQIEIWGAREDIDQALKQWFALSETVLTKDLQERSKRKVKGWAKPEKALSEKQKRKIERREAREREDRDYRGFPPDRKPFNGHFVFPNSEIPISRIIGEKEETLHPVRAETKCYMWYEPSSNLIRIVGDTYDSVEEATMRVKHLYIKVVASRSVPNVTNKDNAIVYKGWVLHMIEPPNKPYKVRIANPAPWFNKPHDVFGLFKLLEPVLEGDKISVVGKNGGSRELNPNSNFDALHNIRVSNVKRIEDALIKAFGTIHLFDEEIKMRIRFGHVCLTDFPREPLWAIDRLNDKILSDSRLQSKFATCIANHFRQLDALFEILSDCDRQWDGSPFREYKILVIRRPPPMGRNARVEPWPCAFDVQFKEDGKIGLWNVTTHDKNILDINMSCLDNVYSWKLNIKTAKRLPNDKFNALGTFVYKLRLSQNNEHLVYSNTDEINVTSVCEKNRWKYWWGDHYVVEVTRYKFWDLKDKITSSPGVEVPLDKESAAVTYGVSFYRKSWEDNFAFNSNLNVGETPEWHPYDIMEETGGVNALLSEIRNFLEVLQDKLPLPVGNRQ
ncbi:hypothetical protein RhiirA1_439954 [Rhizophagus irregularis]|uniref:DUF7905 domain-containing protein n=2 Tax=Rhizophagus irregularis TaxID=588596 RepID=A0A2I1EED0_9GLOM|nr:hypothetical protein RirG_185550 [Rhizophagus irregularis DAOM 197198w]PKC69553.1 hypothetical protein RhiirA1_439954 [Rhizophagus irregularis]GBC36122.1 hypothetical protein RIR_jg2491.t1 [Rhizophagus irregularis DAOM 181602=DAOM 197198]PKK71145.1 hypothetical protein RhiirC2_849380 [Rhizophagus irregularis]PKY20488.1 hypothetical protein RhiirB3_469808 [Rhizophagus irregularis]